MARTGFEELEKESTGGFERFLFLVIPIIFTVVLLGVLLMLLNTNVRNEVLGVANKIPVVKNWVPDPVKDPAAAKLDKTKAQVESATATIKELKSQLEAKEADLQKAKEDQKQQDSKIKSLQTQIDQLQESSAQSADAQAGNTADDYEKQVKNLAKMYAGMSPSKAAPILQNMTTEEVVQLLSAMDADSRMNILAKMDPKMAADITLKMKDSVSSSDLAIAALQSRVNKDSAAQTTPSSTGLDKAQISQTFGSMNADSAANLLLAMYKISPDKVLTILGSVADSTRSSILDSMSKTDQKTSAVILNKLLSSK
ncbi:MotE family protein [Paenibacillus cineris]|uniref:Magnesium transporter MgtE intracellular domain-containing protein n=1 Tax=Paenibacillus cineris TaxID=237530 RepID=A0ABQ4L9A8_9BACL|nr:kinesin [Paenibacillus cineris]GIO53169.1 hypothetical protein J21TS7_14870 [Paenibacillus cineris]